MWKPTLKSLAAHKLRLALTAFAVVLGIAFMAGTLVLTDTITRDIDSLFTQTTAGKAVVVRAVTPYKSDNRPSSFGGNNRPLTPDSVLGVVRSTPGVSAADGSVQGEVTIVKPDGKLLKKFGRAPSVLSNWWPDRQLSSLTLRSGRGPERDGEVAIDAGTARTSHLHLGDRITIISNQPPQPFTIVGIVGFGKQDSIAGATLAAVDTPTAQRLVGKPGFFEDIQVAAAPGATTDTLLTAVGAKLPPGYEAVSAAGVAQQNAKTVNGFISIFKTVLLAFALIALFVGAFLIFNTFSILVGQRTRELALLRAIGASRRQVTASVLGEAVIVGLLGSTVGLVAGYGLATGLYGLLKSSLSLGTASLQLQPRTIIVSLVVGTLVTLVAAVSPAIRASRVPPVAAMRDDAVIAETSLRRRAIVGGTVAGAGVIALALGLFANAGIGVVGIGAALTFVGVAMLIPFIAAPLARALGWPLPIVQGVTGRLGRENAARNPRRTAATASALMIGLAVVGAVATLATSATASFGGLFDRSFQADYVITTNTEGFPPTPEAAVRSAPGVTAMSPFAELQWHEGGASKVVGGLDPVTGPKVFKIQMVQGSVAALGQDQLLVDDTVARNRHLRVGDTIVMGFVETGDHKMTVGGTYKTNQLLDNYLLSTTVIAANTTQVQDRVVMVKTVTRSAAEQAALTKAVAAYPQLKVKTAAQFKADMKNRVATFLKIVYVLLAFSIIIALIGVVNTLALSVLERTREIGLLRAIGMGRRQIRGMIRGEAVVVSLLGAVLGLGLGVGFGAAIVSALNSSGITQLAIPVSTIVVVLVAAALFGVFASVFPARRAARLDVLRAISA